MLARMSGSPVRDALRNHSEALNGFPFFWTEYASALESHAWDISFHDLIPVRLPEIR